jgi:hypothetical protein
MATTAGTIGHTVNITDTLAAGATRPAAFAAPIQITKSLSYANGNTAALQVNRQYYFSGSAVATPTTINLSTVVCIDNSVGFTFVRELWIWNDGTVDAHTLACFGGTTPFAPHLAGTTPTQIIHPGGLPGGFSKPLGTAGHAVGSNINVKIDPGANTIAFRIYVLGY